LVGLSVESIVLREKVQISLQEDEIAEGVIGNHPQNTRDYFQRIANMASPLMPKEIYRQ